MLSGLAKNALGSMGLGCECAPILLPVAQLTLCSSVAIEFSDDASVTVRGGSSFQEAAKVGCRGSAALICLPSRGWSFSLMEVA